MGALSRASRGAAILWLISLAVSGLAQVPEPETVFFGRIINRTSGQEYQLHEGMLVWTISGGGSAPLTVTAPIETLQGGAYSYKLKVPHQAKSLDLTVAGDSLPLRPTDVDFESGVILVNGEPAVPVGGSSGFTASQPKRGAVHRLDLEVFHALDDSDGDGIPDWWEDLHGLDKQWAGDAALRFGNNRYTYLQAFRLGLDPRTDDQLPQLLTHEVTVMSQGATGLLLRTVASTTAPAQIVYRLAVAPTGGSVLLRNARPDPRLPTRTLKAGDTFTQEDIDAGLVEFAHVDPAVTASLLKLNIFTANRPLVPIAREVAVAVFRPDAAEGRAGELWAGAAAPAPGRALDLWERRATSAFAEEWAGAAQKRNEIAAALLARGFDFTVWDGRAELPSRNLSVPSAGMNPPVYKSSFVSRFGKARHHAIFAGDGSVRIEAGMNSDILIGGKGTTTMRGNAGADVFVAGRGKTVIEDFKKAEGDVLDLSSLLLGSPGALTDRVEVTSGENSQLRIPLGGTDAVVITLQGVRLAATDLETWRRAGTLFTGDLSAVETPENHAPVAVDDAGYVAGGNAVTIPVLTNDGDEDGDAVELESVTQGAAGTAEIVGDTVLYTPGPGFAGADDFTYTIGDGRGGTASGHVTISFPFPAAAGAYTPLLVSADGAPVGNLNVSLQSTGAFSIKVRLRGVTYSGKGRFDADGNAEVVLRAERHSISVSLSIDLENPDFPLTGEISGGGVMDHLLAGVADAEKKDKLDAGLKFTLALNAPSGVPIASGFATVNLARSSAARIAGQLADGTPFSAAATRLQDGSVTWMVNLPRGAGWLLGTWMLQESPNVPIGGTTRWVRAAGPALAALDRLLPTVGSLYVAPSVAEVSALDFPSSSDRHVVLSLREGGLGIGSDTTLDVLNRDKMQAPTGSSVKLKLNRPNGVFSGTVEVDGAKRAIRGAVLQDQNHGFGYFLNGLQPGSAELVPQ